MVWECGLGSVSFSGIRIKLNQRYFRFFCFKIFLPDVVTRSFVNHAKRGGGCQQGGTTDHHLPPTEILKSSPAPPSTHPFHPTSIKNLPALVFHSASRAPSYPLIPPRQFPAFSRSKTAVCPRSTKVQSPDPPPRFCAAHSSQSLPVLTIHQPSCLLLRTPSRPLPLLTSQLSTPTPLVPLRVRWSLPSRATTDGSGRRLYIGNLAYATTEGELKTFFKDFLVYVPR
jgi:hypothetical protein